MDVREKLVELLTDNLPRIGKLPKCDNPLQYTLDEIVERIADHLIAHGVTVQEWISVKDRLPIEEAKAYEKEWDDYPEYIVMIDRGWLPATLYYDWEENEWFSINTALERKTYKVTHWMPLPQPPKGE